MIKWKSLIIILKYDWRLALMLLSIDQILKLKQPFIQIKIVIIQNCIRLKKGFLKSKVFQI